MKPSGEVESSKKKKKSRTLESEEKERSTQETEESRIVSKILAPTKTPKSREKSVKKSVKKSKTLSKRSKEASKKISKISKIDENNVNKPSQLPRSRVKSRPATPKNRKIKKPSAETDEMPPTANSEKSEGKEKKKVLMHKKKKSASLEPGEQKPKEALPKTCKSAEQTSRIKMKIPAITPTPDVVPTAKSSEMAARVKNPIEEVKKPKKRMVLKRETNHVYHLRPNVSRSAEHERRQNFEKELMEFETGEFTYLTDPTRYRFRSVPAMELVIQYVFPSLLVLAILLSSMAIYRFLIHEGDPVLVYNEMSEMTLAKYDIFMIVDDIDDYIHNKSVLQEINCPGLVQGPYRPLEKYEMSFGFLELNVTSVKRAVKALTYRWMYQTDAVMNMNFECPPSVIIELEK